MLKKKIIYLLLFFFLFPLGALKASLLENDSLKNRQLFDTYINKMSSFSDEPLNILLVKTAKYFLEKPYVASTLEVNEEEKLVVNFEEFDCTTFVETCLALSQTLKSEQQTYEDYCRNLTRIRYRSGVIDGYTSRLHYMTDWIDNAEVDNTLSDISMKIGGEKSGKMINFMSNHPQYYKQLKENNLDLAKIKEIESSINKRDTYSFVLKQSVDAAKRHINDGDIIIFATSIDGLDYSHIGIAYRQNGELYFIHASSRMKKVIVESKTLDQYCKSSKQCTGISVLRLNELAIR